MLSHSLRCTRPKHASCWTKEDTLGLLCTVPREVRVPRLAARLPSRQVREISGLHSDQHSPKGHCTASGSLSSLGGTRDQLPQHLCGNCSCTGQTGTGACSGQHSAPASLQNGPPLLSTRFSSCVGASKGGTHTHTHPFPVDQTLSIGCPVEWMLRCRVVCLPGVPIRSPGAGKLSSNHPWRTSEAQCCMRRWAPRQCRRLTINWALPLAQRFPGASDGAAPAGVLPGQLQVLPCLNPDTWRLVQLVLGCLRPALDLFPTLTAQQGLEWAADS